MTKYILNTNYIYEPIKDNEVIKRLRYDGEF